MNSFTRTFAIGFAALSLVPSRGACQTSRLAGDWMGSLDIQTTSLRIVFHIAHTEDMKWKATMDSPDQGATGIGVDSVAFGAEGETYIGLRAIGGYYTGKMKSGDSVISGTWNQGGASLPLDLVRQSKPVGLRRPQEPKPPLPYDEEEVTFRNENAGIDLAGTLTKPRGKGPFTAVVLVSGSGPQDRNETVFGHRPFLVLADHLTRNGIAVLRYDDRGTAKSKGDFGTATSVDFASDAGAALGYLASRPDIDAKKLGVIGHSEGGIIAPMVAAGDQKVAFIILLAGPSITGREIILLQDSLIATANGSSPEDIAKSRRANVRLFDVVASTPDTSLLRERLRTILEEEARASGGDSLSSEQIHKAIANSVAQLSSPWFRFFLTYDPMPTLGSVRCPILALNGEKDLQVPAAVNLGGIRRAATASGNKRATVEVMAGLNHLFQNATTGSPMEYGRIEQTFAPVALERISSWIAGITR